ncbi:MAG: histidine kinase [Parabacteroides sp.]|nr:histidine kinase [Parabacteroides sp.]
MKQLKLFNPYDYDISNKGKLFFISLIGALFISYPNIAWIPWDLKFRVHNYYVAYFVYLAFRFLFFWAMLTFMLWNDFRKCNLSSFFSRLVHNVLITIVSYVAYVVCTYLFMTLSIAVIQHNFDIDLGWRMICPFFRHGKHLEYFPVDCFGSILIFQLFTACALSTFIGHVAMLVKQKSEKEQEIETLRNENLQSRCEALANQINPHFFFNSLNGISALIRKKDEDRTVEYVNKLSDIFRYILQNDKHALVPLSEELGFIEAFKYVMEVRFANKLIYIIDVPDNKKELQLPVLSLLPLVDNVVVHNVIDSEHKMTIKIKLNEVDELVVSNPIYPKLIQPETNGTGLKNLEGRFNLLMGKQIRIESDEVTFSVYLPLK